ncbi:MAG: sigma-70 family RNA polymerase sigma factor [Ilumatobacteraceae bacterium]
MTNDGQLQLVKDVSTMWPSELVELYRAEYAPMVRVAYGILGRRTEAEEVVQDAVLHLRARWDRLDNPTAYLRRSVVNGCISVVRRRGVAERAPVDAPPDGVPDRMVELRDVLLRLPEQQRAAIVLRHVAAMPDEEIAAALGVRRATVRSLVARGLHRLHEEIGHD